MIPASKLELEVQIGLFQLGYKNIPASIVGGFGIASLFGLTLWNIHPTQGVLIWTACAFASNAIAWYLYLSFRKTYGACAKFGEPSTKESAQIDTEKRICLSELKRWRGLHVLFMVTSAGVWGGSGALLNTAYPIQNVLILSALLGILAFSASSHGVHNIMSYVVSAVLSLPVMLYFLSQKLGASAFPVAVMFVLFSAVCTLIGVNAHRTMIQAIRLRLANERLASERAVQAQRADQANRDKSNFLAAAAHDLRQPVHALLMLVGVLRQSKEPRNQPQILDQMQLASQTIGELFSAVMELSKLESGQARANLEAIDVVAFVTERVTQHQAAAIDKGLRLKLYVQGVAQGAWVSTDKLLLLRVLDNLIANAVRYTEKGGILVTLRKHSARKLYLEIWDTGIGIQDGDLGRVFDPYVQVGNAVRQREKGLGLGLAIVKNACELMGVPLELKSRLGRGSRFRLLLPRVAAAPVALPALGEDETRGQDCPALEGKVVLVVEDDPMVSSALLTILSMWGAQATHANSYDEALAQIALRQPQAATEVWRPDLILCDYRLPGKSDGLATLEKLHMLFPLAACVLQTGEIAPEIPVIADARRYGLLIKPVTVERLAVIVTKTLEEKKASRSNA